MSALDYRKLLEEERKAALQVKGAQYSSDQRKQTAGSANKEVNTNCLRDVEQSLYWDKAEVFQTIQLTKLVCMDSLHYADGVISAEIEKDIVRLVEQQSELVRPWRQLRTRSLQCWGSFPDNPHLPANEQISAPMPKWLDAIIDDLVLHRVFDPNMRPDNVLINRYEPNQGILHHTDGPAYHDRVAILSLSSDCIMSFRRKLPADLIGIEYGGDVCSVLLKQRSLFVFEHGAYSEHMHGISDEPAQTIGDHGLCVNVPSALVGTKVG